MKLRRRTSPRSGNHVKAMIGVVAACAAMVTSTARAQPSTQRSLVVRNEGFARRFALVIGNGRYEEQEVLENALNDAQDVHRRLTEIGFRTEILLNGSREQMEGAVDRFTRGLQRGDLAVVYYAGHGVAYQGTSYLVPVEYRGRSGSSLERDAYSATTLVSDLAAREATSVVIFDACRNNPFTRSIRTRSAGRRRGVEGFSTVEAPRNADMVVINSTSPGTTASDESHQCAGHSPFTCALLRRIVEPRSLADLSTSIIADVRDDTGGQQRPWFSLASARTIILTALEGSGAEATATAPQPPAPAESAAPPHEPRVQPVGPAAIASEARPASAPATVREGDCQLTRNSDNDAWCARSYPFAPLGYRVSGGTTHGRFMLATAAACANATWDTSEGLCCPATRPTGRAVGDLPAFIPGLSVDRSRLPSLDERCVEIDPLSPRGYVYSGGGSNPMRLVAAARGDGCQEAPGFVRTNAYCCPALREDARDPYTSVARTVQRARVPELDGQCRRHGMASQGFRYSGSGGDTTIHRAALRNACIAIAPLGEGLYCCEPEDR